MTEEADFGIVRILRPYAGFETLYEGQPATGATAIPIMLSEGGIELDDLARDGVAGYDPDLVRGLPVPKGARVSIWYPTLAAASPPRLSPYVYQILWRYRNTADYRRTRTPYHFPKQIEGVAETVLNPGPRVVIPASLHTMIYNQTEPTIFSPVTQNLHEEAVAIGGATINPPLNSNGNQGVIQQGILPSQPARRHTRPSFKILEVQAEGDELLIAVTRYDDLGGASSNWGFAGVDAGFSNYYGNGSGIAYPDLGVEVSVGAAP